MNIEDFKRVSILYQKADRLNSEYIVWNSVIKNKANIGYVITNDGANKHKGLQSSMTDEVFNKIRELAMNDLESRIAEVSQQIAEA